ncbi:23S rRNA (uridine(2552)-2'-O)-methyltransferase RlmE [Alloalcanivorax venustensis]|jgi:23S rRNA (uridine2552-2'-O)-methyltransferase|uniref:Ribosomal RNA large subunit methyltransferase E n=1 Tax=Alloalcanivorax venustensis ISO4 TaxID=1177184 RepID=A0ABS0AC50_9GAMM|nr:23S rRNA (uridine(2552)-2'-O)-methyltransferase RlmE [Alloalcanivorax venustensis]MAQ34950.1 23S rRNA (uridine(2552)-2'-O)-methyltransferase RlmE [Alcanivorax sp.]MCH9784089.1 23S rRNA (uridine(2552)-2'-O)-methyltransferase RlmE [Gammaproteobacteria bacterium]MEA3261263.1 23S rRNA (uridine(2552)-2'-O)-methyltransferase RlmE [Pseudomonadota bacterium]SMO53797.1 23S rRNA Um-2552 2'-O-methyltransferase [Alcanivorax sp. DSM 26295]MBF5051695.1 ribosomal RNA large subunit methyltransferase J [All|tara:strand:- start:52161 stop:52778 length:618 start_codon:yes stop_codon:yes gene_type:complete
MAKSKSSQRWLKEHFDDHWVTRARAEGYRSRASFKLLEIHEKDKLFRPGMTVLDLGAAPGGWSQVAGRLVGSRGTVVASDILAMDAIPDVTFVQGDFREQAVYEQIVAHLNGRKVDLVLSDMAPNMSGNKAVDLPRSMYLAELALDMALNVLEPRGAFLVKVFHGEGFDQYRKALQGHFQRVVSRKPAASRPRSTEVYQLGSHLK